MPTDEDKLGVLSKLAMFANEGDDEEGDEEASGRARLAGGSRPLTSEGARALVREAHEDTPTPHEAPADPVGGDEGPPSRLRARPGQPSARQDVAQVARPMAVPVDDGPATASVCARLRARLRASVELITEASTLIDAMRSTLEAAHGQGCLGGATLDEFDARKDEWDERVTDMMVM